VTLQQFHSLKQWHAHHDQHPMERNAWDVVLTLWMCGWTGGVAALILSVTWASALCFGLLFVPNLYVGLRHRLHRRGRLRCDWITAIR
jgi:hypothetical protein